MSPDPCHGTGSAWESSNLPERIAGRNLVSPVVTRMSDFRRAWRKVSGRGDIPDNASSTGLANSSNVTMVETGLPGRPKKYLWECLLEAELTRPNTTGR